LDPVSREVTFVLGDKGEVKSSLTGLYFYPSARDLTNSSAPQTIERVGETLEIITDADADFTGEFPGDLGGILATATEDGPAWRSWRTAVVNCRSRP